MKKPTIIDWIKSTCSSIGWKLFIWGLGIPEEMYWEDIYQQEKRKRMLQYSNRRSGRSTVIIDHLIQNFFKKGKTAVYDHHPTREATRLIFNTTLQRLQREHHIHPEDISIDKTHFILTNLKHELHSNKK